MVPPLNSLNHDWYPSVPAENHLTPRPPHESFFDSRPSPPPRRLNNGWFLSDILLCIQFSRVNAVSNENLGFLQQMNDHLCGENKVNLFGRRHVEQTFFHSVDMHWKLMNHFAIFLKKERKKRSIFTLDRSFASIFFFAVFDSIWKLETELIFHRNKLTVHEFHFCYSNNLFTSPNTCFL